MFQGWATSGFIGNSKFFFYFRGKKPGELTIFFIGEKMAV